MVPPRWRRTWLALLGILASYQASKRRNLIVRDDLVIVKEEVHWSKKKKGVVSQMRRDVFYVDGFSHRFADWRSRSYCKCGARLPYSFTPALTVYVRRPINESRNARSWGPVVLFMLNAAVH